MEKIKNNNYRNLLQELRGIIEKSKYQAYKAVDNIKVQTYWQIGERIVREELKYQDRADYEKYLINNLSLDLSVSKRLLYEIVNFYRVYPIVHTVCAQLSWSHLCLLTELKYEKERKFYETKTINNSWSVRELAKHIKSQLYQKTNDKEIKNTFKTTLPTLTNIQNIFKPVYDLNFLTIESRHPEKELESKIINKIELFLKELGSDFSFLERQMPILIDEQKHFIDLVLFHRGIPCIVLVDLKTGRLDSRDIGQMNKYINYYRNNRQYVSEQDAIGLIICREVGREEVVYALGGLEEKIFVAKYKIKLPSEEKIKKVIRGLYLEKIYLFD
jgi:predicted nuclease of restriction endonuclease-like (RecB) superfamily